MAASIDRDLQKHVRRLRQQQGDMIRIEDVAQVARALAVTLSAADRKLYKELEDLSDYIRHAKAELAQLRPDELKTRYIASATDELDAIVGATETATNTILDTAERLQDLADELEPELARRLSDATTTIFEACNFQDITGQRITKVVRALKHIEERIQALVAAFDGETLVAADNDSGGASPPSGAKPTDAELLNGPQMPDLAHDQAAVDALFKNS